MDARTPNDAAHGKWLVCKDECEKAIVSLGEHTVPSIAFGVVQLTPLFVEKEAP